MTKLYTLLFLVLAPCYAQSQIIAFTDPVFKSELVSGPDALGLDGLPIGVDGNNDGEIEVSEALLVGQLTIENVGITSLQGIEYFTNLISLRCNDLNLASLNVSSLSQLLFLYCQGNELTTLDLSSMSLLRVVECQDNQLTELVAPTVTDLRYLYCQNNQLTTLTVAFTPVPFFGGSDYNRILYCQNNNLESLNVSGYMQHLLCNDNNITSFTSTTEARETLQYFECQNNLLTALDITGLSAIEYFDCSHNNLTELQFINLYPSDYLDLENFKCSYNQLTTLDLPNGMSGVVSCDNNLLQTMDVSRTLITSFYCFSNPLETLFMKKQFVSATNFNFSNTPNLYYICVKESDIPMIQQKLAQQGNTTCEVNSYCSFNPSGVYYLINGTARYDFDSNGCNITDYNYPHLKYNITTGSISSAFVGSASGAYTVAVPSGAHTLTPVLENPYFTVSPASASVSFPTTQNPATRNFCMMANGSHPDLEIVVFPLDDARPGFESHYKVVYKNKGTMTQSGTVAFTYDESILDFITSQPAAVASSGSLSWNFVDLLPFETREIIVTVDINSPTDIPAVNADDVLHYTAVISSAALDDIPFDNISALNQTVVNSLDPNDKTCLEGTTVTPEMVGEYVHYIIRFENTGTFAAENIVVKDMIDLSKFDIATLIPLNGSHSFETRISSGNKVEFIFENIQLPFDDANNDGFVAFKIKTKSTLVVGDTFSNSASIYFDYNFPILTDLATTTIAALGNLDFAFSNYFTLYPNPAKNLLNIQVKDGVEVKSINIYNILGQLVLAIPNAQEIHSIDTSNLETGNYVIKIRTDNGTSASQFIKE